MLPIRFATTRDNRFRRAAGTAAGVLLLALTVATWMPAVALAVPADVFEVRGVSVDATAESAAAARDEALAQGQREAFYRLLQRLTLKEDHSRLPNLSRDAVATYVRDFSVSDEKTSNVRYLARLNVRFKSADVRALLNEFSIPFAETRSKPAVVLPVLRTAATIVLWDDPNPWRAAWSKMPPPDGLVPMIVPPGDLSDVGTIGARQAADGDTTRLRAIARRYDAGATVVAEASLTSQTDGQSLEVSVTRYGDGESDDTRVLVLSSRQGEEPAAFFARAARETATYIEDGWKADNLMRYEERGVIAASVAIRSLQQWLTVRDRLRSVPVIDRLDLVVLSRDEARLNLHYIGKIDQLTLAMQQADLKLEQVEGAWYIEAEAGSQGAGNAP